MYGGQSVERNELPDGRGIDSQGECSVVQSNAGSERGQGRRGEEG
jgi:hypothetical protein